MFKIMNECFYAKCKTSLRIAAAWETSGNSWWFTTSNHIPFRFGCWPREASRLEAKTHEAEAEAEATTHEAEAEAEAEARFFGLEAEARPRGLTSLERTGCALHYTFRFRLQTKSRPAPFPITKPIQCAHSV